MAESLNFHAFSHTVTRARSSFPANLKRNDAKCFEKPGHRLFRRRLLKKASSLLVDVVVHIDDVGLEILLEAVLAVRAANA